MKREHEPPDVVSGRSCVRLDNYYLVSRDFWDVSPKLESDGNQLAPGFERGYC